MINIDFGTVFEEKNPFMMLPGPGPGLTETDKKQV